VRLSVWQQFSSNHSASYTVVGVFESADAAQAANEKIRQIISEIVTWNDQNRDQLNEYGWRPNPVEVRLAQDYGFEWKQPVDWLRLFPRHFPPPYQTEPQEHVMTLDRVLLVETGGVHTWQTGHQFVHLIEATGGTPYASIHGAEHPDDGTEVYERIQFELQCTAPTAEVAAEIYQHLKTHLEDREKRWIFWHPIPWITYHPHYNRLAGNVLKEQFLEVESVWLQEHKAWHDYFASHYPHVVSDGLLEQEVKLFIKQDAQLGQRIQSLRSQTTLHTGVSTLHDKIVELKDADAGMHLAEALLALLAWMQAQGCTVNYQFHQVEHE